jgi:hypothetical protein
MRVGDRPQRRQAQFSTIAAGLGPLPTSASGSCARGRAYPRPSLAEDSSASSRSRGWDVLEPGTKFIPLLYYPDLPRHRKHTLLALRNEGAPGKVGGNVDNKVFKTILDLTELRGRTLGAGQAPPARVGLPQELKEVLRNAYICIQTRDGEPGGSMQSATAPQREGKTRKGESKIPQDYTAATHVGDDLGSH